MASEGPRGEKAALGPEQLLEEEDHLGGLGGGWRGGGAQEMPEPTHREVWGESRLVRLVPWSITANTYP